MLKFHTLSMFLWMFTTCSCGDAPDEYGTAAKIGDSDAGIYHVSTGVPAYGAGIGSGGIGPIFVDPPDNCADAECDPPEDWDSYEGEDPVARPLLLPTTTNLKDYQRDAFKAKPGEATEQEHPSQMNHL